MGFILERRDPPVKIKHARHLTWDDLPGIEKPFLASLEIGCRFTGRTSRDAGRIQGLDAILGEYRRVSGRLRPPEDGGEECLWLIEQIGHGALVIVYGREYDMDRPMSPVLYWRTEKTPEGFPVPMRGYPCPWPDGVPPDGHWIANPGLPWSLRRRIEECLEQGRRDETRHRGVPEKYWWGLLLQGYRTGGSAGGNDSAPVKHAVGRGGGGDKIVSLDEPDPGFVKAGLFSPRPPRMSDKAFEANMCEWACECMNALGPGGTHQSCVDARIRAQYYDSTNHPKDDSPVWSEVSYYKDDSVMRTGGVFGGSTPVYEKNDMVESREYPGKPSSWYPRTGTWRLDVVKIGPDGEPEKFYDMKFPGDEPKNDLGWEERKRAYEAIAEKHTGDKGNYDTFVVEEECPDCGKQTQEQRQPQPEQAMQEKSKSLWQQFKDWDRLPEKPPIGPSKPTPPATPPILPLPGMPIPI